MTDVVCSGCLSRQAAGTQYCGVCGREFPRTGRPVVEQQPGPQSAVQQLAGGGYGAPHGQDLPYHHGGSRIDDEFQTGTFVPVRDPGPAPAAPEPVYAHVGRRIVALLVDGAVGGALFGIVYGIALLMAQPPEGVIAIDENEAQAMLVTLMAGLWGGLGLMLVWNLSMWIWEGTSGKTLGNVALGIRTLSARDEKPVGFWRIVLRVLVVGAGSLACGVGSWVVLLSPLWDKGGRKQGWHDKAAGAVVIDIKKKPAPVVEGFDPDSRPRAPGRVTSGQGAAGRGVPGPRTPAPGTPAPGSPAAPASPGALRAAGQAHTAASSAGQAPVFDPVQQAGPQAPASFTPDGSPAPAQPDPWSFPKASGPPTGDGLITDVPGGAAGPAGPFPPVSSGQQGQAPSSQQWPGGQPSAQPQQPMLPGAPPASPPEAAPPTASSTPSPPATPNSPRPITAANTIPDHPLLETSPYPPISQPQRRDSQPTRAVSIDPPGQGQGSGYGRPPRGQHAAPQGPDPDATNVEQAAGPASDETMLQMPTGSSGAMDPPPVMGAVLELESGARVRVDGPTLVGRNPQAPGSAGVQLVQLPDPTRSVSKNHAELGVDSAGLWLTDRGSTNGTVVSVPGLPPRVAEAGARVRVPVGSTIHFGDRRVVVHPGAEG
ncbi:RDD family protein [Myceligenerans pegani]|uniref:RDD family protein n=1 Tax=Myceligenerans pegani TaxID=2776917 RepID=A0ABR9N5E1_9MICO|nr:RDD family protein [Myceligenerans sp. TRM 65318]MBE1878879.1 RDD family protein [Myceligenerans sp. TRM 65318]MBE3021150.1 RDD family protein [Myceligenerans sp. TRM 65318]